MGDFSRNADQTRDVLERIVALLVALAGLADRASGLPAHRRREVLGILMRGEGCARAFVTGMAGFETVGCDDDAAWLAESFRALARMLCGMLALMATRSASARQSIRWHRIARRNWRPAAAAIDTS